MSNPHVVRGYSEFFTSGFKAATNRTQHSSTGSHPSRHQPSKPFYVVDTPQQTKPDAPPKSRRTLSDLTHRRRPASMIVSSTPVASSGPNESSSSRPRDKHSRPSRSSIGSFLSSRLFDRKVSTSSTAAGTGESSTARRRSSVSGSTSSFSATDSAGLPEVWITAGGPYTPSAPNGSAALFQPMDPFTSAPNARSIFVDSWSSTDNSPASALQITPLPPSPSAASISVSLSSTTGSGPKRESFLSLTTSTSSNRSSSMFFVHRDRPDRPTSVHTMPLPSASRRSSYQYWTQPQGPPTPGDRLDNFFLIREEEDEPCSPATCRNAHEGDLEWSPEDAPARIDWREFHLDLLTDDTQ